MKKAAVMLLLILTSAVYAQDGLKDYYHLSTPLQFNNNQYSLVASYHPQDNYYKQEYGIKGENPDAFHTLMTVDVLTTTMSPKEVMMQKIAELDERKKSDPVVHHTTYEQGDKGEYMLDFLLSSSSDNAMIVEWNIYRYVPYKDARGRKGVMLMAYSWRGYNNDIKAMMTQLKAKRTEYVNMMGALPIPAVRLD